MNFLFLMDPLETISADKDTTLAFMSESFRRGHRTFYLSMNGMTLTSQGMVFDVIEVEPLLGEDPCFRVMQSCQLHQDEVASVFVRKDPPFDSLYLQQMWLLDLIADKVFVTNAPSGIRTVNEKIWVSQFSEWTPTTLLTSSKQEYQRFLEMHEQVIVKPTSGFGGQGVFKVTRGDSNASVIFEMLTEKETDYVVVQDYVPQAVDGDKRVLLLNGDVLGAVLRVQKGTDHRNNFFSGGEACATSLTDAETEIIGGLKPHLRQLGLHFVGLDFIGDRLIEVNVTSPTCLREMNRIYGVCLESSVIDFIERSVLKMNAFLNLD